MGLSTPLTNPPPPPRPPLHSLSPSKLEYLEASEEVVFELSVDEVVAVSSLSSEVMIKAASGVEEVELFAVLLLVLVLVDPFGSISGHLALDLVCFSMELTGGRRRRVKRRKGLGQGTPTIRVGEVCSLNP